MGEDYHVCIPRAYQKEVVRLVVQKAVDLEVDVNITRKEVQTKKCEIQ